MVRRNPADIYGSECGGVLHSPFNLDIDPMKRLILINFDRNPDKVYSAFEAQLFDDPVNGRGMLVIGARRDGRADVYHQPGLSIGHRDFGVVGKGLANLMERHFERARFDLTSRGADAEFSFEDREGRLVELVVRERGSKPVAPSAILAPLGSATVEPPALPLFYLYGFCLVRQAGTEVSIKIDGVSYRPDTLPLPVDGSRVYFLRYSADPFLVEWNVAHDGPLTPLEPGADGKTRGGGAVYDLVDNGGHKEIERMSGANDRHEIGIDFAPALPDIACLRDGVSVGGRFSISCDEATGTVGGEYWLTRRGRRIVMRVQPSEGWRPNERKWSFRFLYLVARVFRNWPRTYRWTAEIDADGKGQLAMRSRWERMMRPR